MFWVVLSKIIAGFCAVLVAAIAGFGLPQKKPGATGFLSKLTFWGIATFFLSILGVVTIVSGEIISAHLQSEQEEEYNKDKYNLVLQLDNTKLSLALSLIDTKLIARKNDYLLSILDGMMARHGIARFSIENSSGSGDPLVYTTGTKATIKNGDVLEWNINCLHDDKLMLPSSDNMCKDIGYGSLSADNYRIDIRERSGRMIFFGTRANGGALTYINPSQNYDCSELTNRMKEARCFLDVEVTTEGKWRALTDIRNDDTQPIVVNREDACQRYLTLSGQTCDEAIAEFVNEGNDHGTSSKAK